MLPHLSKNCKVRDKSTGEVGYVVDMLVSSHDVEYTIKMNSGKVLYRIPACQYEEM